jgi:Glucose / Sorbosone dehydrogenase
VRRALLLGVVAAAVLLGVSVWLRVVSAPESHATPMDIEWADGFGYATVAEGDVVRLTVEGDRVEWSVLASGLQFPRGLALAGNTLFVAELGPLPCENPIPRCKGEHVGPTRAEGERTLLAQNAGRILAFPVTDDGLGEPEALVEELHFTNTDHGLNDVDLGPDGLLYLSVGNLDQLAWDDGEDPPTGPETELLGSVLRIDPTSGDIEVFATGLRNVYGLSFDESGRLWGVDNDGRGRGVWRAEELLEIQDGLDYGFPDDGTVGPYTRRTGYARWIMPTGAGSGGILVSDDVVISGACGRITRVALAGEGGDADERQVARPGCVTAIERLPDGRLILGTVLGDDPFEVVGDDALFER